MPKSTATLIREPAEAADLIIYVVDIIDFHSTFSRRVAIKYAHKIVLVLNKIDLLPARVSEKQVINWAHNYLSQTDLSLRDVRAVSTKNGFGIAALWAWIVKELGANKGTVALIGAGGVGKTALYKSLQDQATKLVGKKPRYRRRSHAKNRNSTSANMPIKDENSSEDKNEDNEKKAVAISRRRTRRRRSSKKTKSVSTKQIIAQTNKVATEVEKGNNQEHAQIKLLDTPDLPVNDSMRSLLCHECSQKMMPAKRLRSRLIRLKPGQCIALGEYAAISLVSSSAASMPVSFRLFISPVIAARRITEGKLRDYLAKAEGFRPTKCLKCGELWRESGWEELEAELHTNQDIELQGIGWLQALQHQVVIRVILPAGVAAVARPRLVEV